MNVVLLILDRVMIATFVRLHCRNLKNVKNFMAKLWTRIPIGKCVKKLYCASAHRDIDCTIFFSFRAKPTIKNKPSGWDWQLNISFLDVTVFYGVNSTALCSAGKFREIIWKWILLPASVWGVVKARQARECISTAAEICVLNLVAKSFFFLQRQTAKSRAPNVRKPVLRHNKL